MPIRITAPTKATKMLVMLMPLTAFGIFKKCSSKEATNQSPDCANDGISHQTVAPTAHHPAGQPAGNQPNDDP